MRDTGGMGRGFGIAATVDHSIAGEIAGEAERLGYTSFWSNDVPSADGLATLAATLATTERIRLGVGVIPLDRRSPREIAGRIDELGLPPDRLVLGVGSGADRRPLELVRDGVDPLRHAASQIVVGALRTRMSQLAGEAADGVLFNWMTPEHSERMGRHVVEAAAQERRPPTSLMAYVRCGLMPGAAPRLDAELGRYTGVESFERHIEAMGVSARDTCFLDADPAVLQEGIARHEAVLDETIVRAVTPTDGIDDLLALLRACAP